MAIYLAYFFISTIPFILIDIRLGALRIGYFVFVLAYVITTITTVRPGDMS